MPLSDGGRTVSGFDWWALVRCTGFVATVTVAAGLVLLLAVGAPCRTGHLNAEPARLCEVTR